MVIVTSQEPHHWNPLNTPTPEGGDPLLKTYIFYQKIKEKGTQPDTVIRSPRFKLIKTAREGSGMGNTCKSMADSGQCMTKPTTIL